MAEDARYFAAALRRIAEHLMRECCHIDNDDWACIKRAASFIERQENGGKHASLKDLLEETNYLIDKMSRTEQEAAHVPDPSL